ncbi:hypothetical protein SAMN02910413_0875 [Pseudobutyrivibrio sp. C4]|uniref:hypothetical protein n=1 Tax=Pseudobutyrivibrio sp. C4 TaxID=1520803 RepID=UPI0008BE2934|nr:hypothetical protein [Pseudobutyrivibrio sp. C4]SES78146.1 hypothetical protein SAMN02910413_0875 [Pseudobutyrivibrio sp. C4]
MNLTDDKIEIKYNWKYRFTYIFFSLAVYAFAAICIVDVLSSEERRVYCITDNIWHIIGFLIFLGVILLFTYGAASALYDRIIIEGSYITIKQIFTKTADGDSNLIEYFSLKKDSKVKNAKALEIYYQGECWSCSTADLTSNKHELIEYLQKRCNKRPVNKSASKKEEKQEKREKMYFKPPSLIARYYVMISRYLFNIAALIYFFFIQGGEIVPTNLLWKVCMVAFIWVAARIIFWQDAMLFQWNDEFPDKVNCKRKFWFNPDFFLATPIIGIVLLYMRARYACNNYHIYELGYMNVAILVFTFAFWLVMSIIKNIFYGRNTMPIRINMVRQLLILFVILMLSGQIVYCGSIMLCREPTVITAELRSKHSYSSRRGGTTYIFQVIDDDGLYEEYKVWSNTYSQYEEGDAVTILVYESVFGTEFRHLEEEYD